VTWAALGEQISTVLSSTTEDVHQFVVAWGAWAALGSIILMVVRFVLPLPGGVIAVANGLMFGRFWGSVITWVGAMIGAGRQPRSASPDFSARQRSKDCFRANNAVSSRGGGQDRCCYCSSA
jgi:hypothetical protein